MIIHCVYQENSAWQLLWVALQFHDDSGHQVNNFRGQIDKFFPPPQPSNALTFSISLNDLESVGLRVRLTRKLHEHLLVEEDTVNIYQLHYLDMRMWLTYHNNKAAKYVVPPEK